MLSLVKMQRDIAAIVDISAFKPRPIQHRAQNLIK
jgi:hypothetical protein